MTNRGMMGTVLGTCALGVGLAALAGAGTTAPTLVSGGGPSKSDCYTEIAVQGISASNVTKNKKITCTDGDPCDTDPTVGTCNVKINICWNQTNLPDCTPPGSLDSLTVKKLAATIPSDLTGSSCLGAFVDLSIATKKHGKKEKPGKANFKVKAKAPKGTKPHTDTDAYQVICVPRPASPSGAFVD